jgi:uncharacterized membrane protein YjfL (UPF0719 family)
MRGCSICRPRGISIDVNTSLFLIGVAKLFFGVLIAAFGVFFGLRVIHRLLGQTGGDRPIAEGNVAVGVTQAACFLSLGLLVQPAVQASFDAVDLLYRGQRLSGGMVTRFMMYGFLHVGTALVVGAMVIAIAVRIFTRLTGDVDELAEIKKGNVAPALTLGAVIIVASLLAAPGLRSILDGLLPLPELPRDVVPMPS